MPVISNDKLWRKIFLLLSGLVLVIMPLLSQDFGQSGDEDVEVVYGQDIVNYFVKGDKTALNYDHHPKGNNIRGMQFYGGMFDGGTEMIHRLFPSWHIILIRHFVGAVFGALLIIFTGLLAYRISRKKWIVGVLASLLMLFSPRIFGESMFNGKDIPFAAGFAMGLYYLLCLLQDLTQRKKIWKIATLFGISWGIIFGMRSAGSLLFVAYTGLFIIVYYVVNKAERQLLFADQYRLLKQFCLSLLLASLIGFALGIFAWPFGLQAPISNLFIALEEMTHRETVLRVLFEGKYTQSNILPWYYEFKWILLTSPVVVILGIGIFLILLPRGLKAYGVFPLFFLVFSAIFPICYIIYKKSNVYDTWRHVFFVYPYWVVLAALGADQLQSFIKGKLSWLPYGLAAVGLFPVILWTVKEHPNQYVYFNAFAGGVQGAFGNYDLDYYQVSGRQSAQWILKNVKRPPAGQKIKVFSNMDGMDWYFARDTSWIATNYARYYERNQQDWDYYITYGRFVSEWQLQNGKWPPGNVVYSVEAGGVPIGVVIERKSKGDYYAYEALKVNDFAKAVTLSEDYLKVDKTNEMVYLNYGIALASLGRLDEAAGAVKAAVALDPVRPDFYQVLAQIYKAKGDTQNADQAMMTAQSIMAQQQEED